MIYSDLIPQPRQWDRLMATNRVGRLAHAHLFHGPAGSGKEAYALELAAALNCENLGNDGACGRCNSCQKMRTLQHPDVHLVVPLPRRNAISKGDSPLKALKPADIEDLTEQMGLKGRDPYHKIHLVGANSILINSVRELRRTASLKPAEGGMRFILIFDAEKLCYPTPAAANALLKLLEEPPPGTVLILVTDRPNLLLETIHSRCVSHYFAAPQDDLMTDYLVDKYSAESATASMVVHATAGNIHMCRQLMESGDEGGLEGAIDELLQALLNPRPQKWQKLVSSLTQMNRSQPAELRFKLQLLQLWFRDLMLLATVPDVEGLIFENRKDDLAKNLKTFALANWGAAAQMIEQAQGLLERNINSTLVMSNLFMDIRQSIKGKEALPVGALVPLKGAV